MPKARWSLIAASMLPAIATAQTTERRIEVLPFDGIEMTGSDNVAIQIGASEALIAHGDARAVAAMTFDVRNHVLHVSRRSGRYSDHGVTLLIKMPRLRSASLRGSGSLTADVVSGPSFDGVVQGSGNLTIRSLKVDHASISNEGAGTIRIPSAASGSLALTLQGSGDATVAGTARSASLTIDGSGNLNARGLAVPDVAIEVNGPGTLQARADRTAQVSATGSGTVVIIGHPHCSVHSAGASSVICG